MQRELNIQMVSNPRIPEKENYFAGSEDKLSLVEKQNLFEYCSQEILNYPNLPDKVMEA